MASPKLRLKLLIDKKQNKVILAEAEKDFVDFLIDLLSLPISEVINILKNCDTYGSMNSLYKSIQDLKHGYLQDGLTKKSLLSPFFSTFVDGVPQMLPKAKGMNFHICRRCFQYSVMLDGHESSRDCCGGRYMSGTSVRSHRTKGYVKGMITYIVMDDLSVRPASMMAGVTLVLNYKDINALEEREVEFGTEEAIKLLKASMHSGTVLTDIFLVKDGGVSNAAIEPDV